MDVVAILPARMGSSRFPGKPLAHLCGRTMIEHVYRRTALASSVDQVLVATCDAEIGAAVDAFGGRWVMTADTHERASDRVAEAARALDADIVVMVQGDEPMTLPDMIDAAVAPMRADPSIRCINLAKRITSEAEYLNPNTIKVVIAGNGDALCFSREPIPTARMRGFDGIRAYKQVCIMPFRRDALLEYAALPPTPGELAESVDMMRFLEHGIPVRMIETRHETHAVDTPDDLAFVESLMANDALLARY